MPKHNIEQVLPNNSRDVIAACQEAVAQLGWRIFEQSDKKIVCKELMKSMITGTFPVQVEITWIPLGNNTRLILMGSNMGIGPIQSGHLKGQMGNLLNRIQICLHKTVSLEQKTAQMVAQPVVQPTTQISLAGELEKLIQLHSKGYISDDEFSKAKAKLLDSTGH